MVDDPAERPRKSELEDAGLVEGPETLGKAVLREDECVVDDRRRSVPGGPAVTRGTSPAG
jgi:hypothetical protein